jgi:hypothetical protein
MMSDSVNFLLDSQCFYRIRYNISPCLKQDIGVCIGHSFKPVLKVAVILSTPVVV